VVTQTMCTLIFYKNLIFLNLTSPKVPLSAVPYMERDVREVSG